MGQRKGALLKMQELIRVIEVGSLNYYVQSNGRKERAMPEEVNGMVAGTSGLKMSYLIRLIQ
jgi:hypothetical protein